MLLLLLVVVAAVVVVCLTPRPPLPSSPVSSSTTTTTHPARNIYELFHTRYNLHKRAYQHRVACAGEMMMVEALVEADRAGFRPLVAADGHSLLKVSEATKDMVAFTALTDSVLRRLQVSE